MGQIAVCRMSVGGDVVVLCCVVCCALCVVRCAVFVFCFEISISVWNFGMKCVRA